MNLILQPIYVFLYYAREPCYVIFMQKLSKHYVIIHNVWPDRVHTVIHVVDVDLFVSE